MNQIPENIPNEIKKLFNKINNYLDNNVYFYGSAIRSDYVPNKSDIDTAIFTDNEYSTISKLQHLLHVKKSEFKKVIWKLNGEMMYGYKIKLPGYSSEIEISIYNDNFKNIILKEYNAPLNQPLICTILLYILKLLYYHLNLISKKKYVIIKRYIQNDLNKKVSHFLIL
jgi:predicted nucleotidyltransferase